MPKFKTICPYLLSLSAVLGIVSVGWGALSDTYYVSSSAGDDQNPGTKENPWKSLEKISETTFNAGETISLMRGDTFEGCVTLNGAGTAESPITLTAYGEGDRPFIKGPGDDESVCVTIPASSQGWHIIGVEIGHARKGIKILSRERNRYYYFEDLYIHDINNKKWKENWDMQNWTYWGHSISLVGGGSVEDLTIKNCLFQGNDCDFDAIDGFSDQGVGFKNILIDGCTITGGRYNSIYQWTGVGKTGERFSITNCLFYKNGVGDMPYGTTSILTGSLSGEPDSNVVSGNEFASQQDSHGNDGCAYDFESTAGGVTFRDNFVHDCFGESILFMPGVNGNVIHRSNVLIEDNLFVKNCTGSKLHKSEIDFLLKDGHSGDITIRNNRFLRLPEIEMIAPVPDCVLHENNVDITDPIVETPEYVFDAAKNTLTLKCADPAAVLHFTTDGSVPTRQSEQYKGQDILVTKTMVVNSKAFRDGYLPSRTCCALVSPLK